MSDARLRELERQWARTGATEDGALFLLERVRRGDLTRERLELAAYCRHPSARQATGAAPDTAEPTDLPQWARGLSAWGKWVCVLAAVSGANSCVRTWAAPRTPPLVAAEAWLLAPSGEALEECRALSNPMEHFSVCARLVLARRSKAIARLTGGAMEEARRLAFGRRLAEPSAPPLEQLAESVHSLVAAWALSGAPPPEATR